MANNRLELDGLAELRDALRRLPQDLTAEASGIVLSAAERAARQIQANYPTGPTGKLKAGVRVEKQTSGLTAAARVRSVARHAHLYEFGTGRRHTDHGANRGAMPKAAPGTAMIPVAIRERAQMLQQLIDLVKRAGFEVSG